MYNIPKNYQLLSINNLIKLLAIFSAFFMDFYPCLWLIYYLFSTLELL